MGPSRSPERGPSTHLRGGRASADAGAVDAPWGEATIARQLTEAATRDRLKWAFSDPDRLRPGETRQSLTERVAASFASVAQALRERGHNPQAVAHFVNRLVFCMFADDVGLLPDHMFTRMLRHARPAPGRFGELAGLSARPPPPHRRRRLIFQGDLLRLQQP